MEDDYEPLPPVPLGNILVTGGSGFLGYHLLNLLLERHPAPSSTISVLDARPPQKPQAGVKYYTANLVNAQEVRDVLAQAKPNVIIHSASPVMRRATNSKKEAEEAKQFVWKVNVEGTATLLEEAKKQHCRCFVYTSSASVVSDTLHPVLNADERWSLIKGEAQKEFYSETKAVAEETVLSQSTRTPTSAPFLTCAIRPSGIFGEYDVQMIPQLIRVLRDGRTRFQLGDNNNLWDFTYVQNVAWGHILAAESLQRTALALTQGLLGAAGAPDAADAASKADGEAFIITNQTPVYFWDFSRAVWHAYYAYAAQQARDGVAGASALLPPKQPPLLSKVWVLDAGLVLSLVRLVENVAALLGLPPLKPNSQEMRYSALHRYFRATKATERLGYRPLYTVEEGIERTVAHLWHTEASNLAAAAAAADGTKATEKK